MQINADFLGGGGCRERERFVFEDGIEVDGGEYGFGLGGGWGFGGWRLGRPAEVHIAEIGLEAGYGLERRRGLRLGLRLEDGLVDWSAGFDRAGLAKLDDLLE